MYWIRQRLIKKIQRNLRLNSTRDTWRSHTGLYIGVLASNSTDDKLTIVLVRLFLFSTNVILQI